MSYQDPHSVTRYLLVEVPKQNILSWWEYTSLQETPIIPSQLTNMKMGSNIYMPMMNITTSGLSSPLAMKIQPAFLLTNHQIIVGLLQLAGNILIMAGNQILPWGSSGIMKKVSIIWRRKGKSLLQFIHEDIKLYNFCALMLMGAGGYSVRRPGSKDPHRREQKLYDYMKLYDFSLHTCITTVVTVTCNTWSIFISSPRPVSTHFIYPGVTNIWWVSSLFTASTNPYFTYNRVVHGGGGGMDWVAPHPAMELHTPPPHTHAHTCPCSHTFFLYGIV